MDVWLDDDRKKSSEMKDVQDSEMDVWIREVGS